MQGVGIVIAVNALEVNFREGSNISPCFIEEHRSHDFNRPLSVWRRERMRRGLHFGQCICLRVSGVQ
jgi:hypothetical protein